MKDFMYVILDDDKSVFNENELKDMNYYKVNQHTGLTVSDVSEILETLK